jgi:peptidoglycan L-alanyl-D-glutamate endopeptidase CwlK
MNALSRKRLALVHPVLVERVEDVAAALIENKILVELVSGFRSFDEQTKLYAQGRTRKGERVTDARAGFSWLNFGLAVDLCPMKRGAFDWDAPLSVWHEISAMAKRHGLAWGGDWLKPDRPHVELKQNLSLAELRTLHAKHPAFAELWTFVKPKGK